jgi:hypothetical protein
VVIQKFNRLIRNKWIWGIFAFAISAFFAFDFLFYDRSNDNVIKGVGMIGEKEVQGPEFQSQVEDIRGIGRQRDWKTPSWEVNRKAWENIAALEVAENFNLKANDSDLQNEIYMICMRNRILNQQGQFDVARYTSFIRDALGITPMAFESHLRRTMTIAKAAGIASVAAQWVSPLELESAIDDQTDSLTVKIASFTDKAIKTPVLDDAALKAYYDENTNSIALPDLVTVRYIALKADDASRLAKFTVSSNDVQELYDTVAVDRYSTTTTNGVVTKPLAEVYKVLENELKLKTSIEAARTNLLFAAYPADAKPGDKADRLAAIAKDLKLQVKTSPRFAVSGGKFVKGFMSRTSAFAPGCYEFTEKVAELDPESADLRYGVAVGTNTVYLMERASFVKAHVPTFKDAKEVIRPDAVADARKKAFKKFVEEKRALAAAALAKGKAFDAKTIGADNVTTSMTFTVESRPSFPDSREVLQSATRLNKGQISEYVETANSHRALLVYLENRTIGKDDKSVLIRSGLQSRMGSMAGSSLSDAWKKWNLDDMGFKTTAVSSVTPEESVEIE